MNAKFFILSAVLALAAAAPATLEAEGEVVPPTEDCPSCIGGNPDGTQIEDPANGGANFLPTPMLATCNDCLSNGLAWNRATSECVKLGCKSADCVNDIRQCNVRPVKPVKPVKPLPPVENCEEVEAPKVCVNMPAGLCKGDIMLPNVTYTVPEAIFGCDAKKCEETSVWCDIKEDKKKPGTFVEKYFFCCGDDCQNMPEEETCKVNGKKYTVGHAYDIKLDGKKVTMWCTSEDEYVTCDKKTCGSTVELTPPGVDSCPVPVYTPVPKPPVRPQPPVVNRPEGIHPADMNCINCISAGNTWEETSAQCFRGDMCPLNAEASCHKDIGRCPVRI